MRLFLAHTASNEGSAETVRANAIHALPRMSGRQPGGGRFEKPVANVLTCEHGHDGFAASENRRNIEIAQAIVVRIFEAIEK